MAFAFTPPDGYSNTTTFPTTPSSEAAFRASMQSLLDQLRDYLNGFGLWGTSNSPSSIAANGYQKMASGLIIQWGKTDVVAPGSIINIVFPISFTTAAKAVNITVESGTASTGSVSGLSTNQCGVIHNDPTSRQINWVAIGY